MGFILSRYTGSKGRGNVHI